MQHAQREGRPLFVSVGYATCHWCHVMAHETFSHQECAQLLNEHFISIKVDREERPDIDQYLMDILMAVSGAGGWPLNVFFDPNLHPIYALTYAAPTSRFGMPSFQEVLQKVLAHWKDSGYQPLTLRTSSNPLHILPTQPSDETIKSANSTLADYFDLTKGGLVGTQKFPPHATLLYLLYCESLEPLPFQKEMITTTLKTMRQRGLYDHVGGGIFRYCTDPEWHIPHYEKMLYDQAMALWCYSAAYHLYREPLYRATVHDLVTVIERDFNERGLYIAGHDADTDAQEGGSYLWRAETLQKELSASEWQLLSSSFDLVGGAQADGTFHLIGKSEELTNQPLIQLLQKLQALRSAAPQPARDSTILTTWNALLGIAFLMAGRYGGEERGVSLAYQLWQQLIARHYTNKHVVHSSVGGENQPGEFLEDYASLLLLGSMLGEEAEVNIDNKILQQLYSSLQRYRINDKDQARWLAAHNHDFIAINAQGLDSPTPSPIALAELATLHYQWGNHEQYLSPPLSFANPQLHPFYNIAALVSQGYFYVVKAPHHLPWSTLPLHLWQYRASRPSYCYQGRCYPDKLPSL